MLRKIVEKIRTSGAFSPGKVCGDYVINQTFQFATNRVDQSPTRRDFSSSPLGESAISTLLPRMGPFSEILQLNLDPALSEKTLSVWEQVTDAKEPQPSQTVKICQIILEDALGCHSWEIRRLISHIAGTALSRITHTKDLLRSLGSFTEIGVGIEFAEKTSLRISGLP